MPSIAKLSVHRNTRDRRIRHGVSKNLVAAAREKAQRKDLDGWALVAFHKDGAGVHITATYAVGDARDAILLPEMAREKLRQIVWGDDE